MRRFLLESRNIEKDSYIWNMLYSLLQSFQSVVLLMIMSRTVGLTQSGIFIIAYANANLFLNIGNYGMRYYQVSDVNEQYSFREYAYSRIVTVVAMMVVSALYTVYVSAANEYPLEKALTVILMCLYKAFDAMEDVFAGRFQQKGRLDIASKALSVRLGLSLAAYALGLVWLKNQLNALIIAVVSSFVLMPLILRCAYAPFRGLSGSFRPKMAAGLLRSCFPLFAGCFLSFYIGNAPKYAIDSMLSDEAQACYGFIAMPVFVVGMLNNFIFNPVLHKMAGCWDERRVFAFVRRILTQTGIIALITTVCLAGAWAVGIPILSWMYDTDLTQYRMELLILILGGGFLGLSGFLNAMITIIRFQKSVVFGYGCVAVLAFFLSGPVVGGYGIMGAAVLYTVLMGGLSICFWGLLVVGIYLKR